MTATTQYQFMAVEPIDGSAAEVFFNPYTTRANYFSAGAHAFTISDVYAVTMASSSARVYPDNRRFLTDPFTPDGFPTSALNAAQVPSLDTFPAPPMLQVYYGPEYTAVRFEGYAVPIPMDAARLGYVYAGTARDLLNVFLARLPVARRGINRLRDGYGAVQCYFTGRDRYADVFFGMFVVNR